MSHLGTGGKMDFNEEAWTKEWEISTPYKFDLPEIPNEKVRKETLLIDLSSMRDNLNLKDLVSHYGINLAEINLLFSDPSKWREWDFLITQKTKDVYIISLKCDSEWPLTLSLQVGNTSKKQTKERSSDIRFMVKSRVAY